MPLAEARELGAMMLFGEKYGEEVRVVTFGEGFSCELCGGTHVQRTGDIGWFKIVSESAIAAGVRRIEALTGERAEQYVQEQLEDLQAVRHLLKSGKNTPQMVEQLLQENKKLKKELEQLQQQQTAQLKDELLKKAEQRETFKLLAEQVAVPDSKSLKNLVFQLEKSLQPAVIVLGAAIHDKPQLMVAISKEIAGKDGLDAGKMVRQLAAHIQGGGGGQPFFASAGGKNAAGLAQAVEEAKHFFNSTE